MEGEKIKIFGKTYLHYEKKIIFYFQNKGRI